MVKTLMVALPNFAKFSFPFLASNRKNFVSFAQGLKSFKVWDGSFEGNPHAALD